jgi:hypothetical protein
MFGTVNILFVEAVLLLRGQALAAEGMGAGQHKREGVFGVEPLGAETALEIIQVVNVHINLTIIYYYKSGQVILFPSYKKSYLN